MYETGVPLRGVHIRQPKQPRTDGFRVIHAVRLDTGMMVKLVGEFSEVDPLQPFVADVLERRVLENSKPTEVQYRVGPNKTGPETVLAAVERKRDEGGDPAAEIPTDFSAPYTLSETELYVSDKAGGPFRVFEAEVGSTRRRVKIVAMVPHQTPAGPMRMALKPSRDAQGRPQREGIYMGEAGEDPVMTFAPELLARPEKGPEPPAPSQGAGPGNETSEPARIDGFRRVRPFREVTRRPNEKDGTIFLLMEARDLDNGDVLRIYHDAVPELASRIGPNRDLLFRETSRKRKRALELRGEIRLPGPEADLITAASPVAPVLSEPERPTAAEATAREKRKDAGLMRIQYDPKLNPKKYVHRKPYPRRDGSTQYFYIFNARDLDTGRPYKVKLYLPDDDYQKELTLHLEKEEASRSKGPYPTLLQSSDHPPPGIGAESFGTGPWETLRVTGDQVIMEQNGGDLDEKYHIFDAVIEGTNYVLKIMGMVPGGDVSRKMTVLVRPKNWRHGEIQYEAGLIEPDPDVTPEVMEGMVARLKAPGLGSRLITKVVERFGNESLYVIRYAPEKLLEVKGVGEGTVEQIRNANHLDLRASILSAMSENGVHLRYFNGILKTFDEDAVEVITTTPYRLTEVSTISFKYADRVAIEGQGRSRHAPDRVEAALGAAVSGLISSGKSGEWYNRVKDRVRKLTDPMGRGDGAAFYQLLWQQVTTESDRDQGLVQIIPGQQPDVMIRFREVVEAEAQIAADLYERSTAGPDWEPFDPTPFLERLQEGSEFKLGQEQVDAVRMVCQHGTSVMTGGPGVGKTTTLKKTVEALERAGVNVLLMAPTGIAAKRMRESTGRHASTVHSAIGRLGNRSEDDEPLIPSDAPTCLVIDESSMVNVFTLQKLLAPLPASVSILFSGDVDQLPSIGPGQVLRDLIESGMVPVSRLDTVYRQGPDSEIIHAARAINAGKMPEVKNDFRIIPANTPEEIRDEVIRQVRQVSAIKGFDVKKDLMVLAPVKKGPAGVVSLNTELQELLNPPSKYKAEISVPRPPENEDESDLAEELMTDRERARAERAKKEKVHHEILRVGDRVIHTRNNYENGLVNGDVGIITSVNPQHREVCVEFNDEPYVLDRDGLNDIRLAYAMTVHKSQGSEAKYVIAPLPPNYTFMLNRNLLYTGVTRGKRTVTVIGSEESVRACVETTAESSADLARHSTLKEHCRALMRAEIELRAEDLIDEIGAPDMS